MGRYHSAGEITWLPLAIHAGAFLKFIFRDYGYDVDTGMVLVADDDVQARQFVKAYCQNVGNGQQISSWKKRRNYPLNYQCGFMTIKVRMAEEELEDFLAEECFLPVVVCGGVLPDFLKGRHYVFRLSQADLDIIHEKEFLDELEAFRIYVVENIEDVCKTLKELGSSIVIGEYEGEESLRRIYGFLVAVGTVYASFLRKARTQREVVDFFAKYIKEVMKALSLMQDFASGEMLKEVVNSLVWKYLDEDNEVVFADVNYINLKAGTAIEQGRALLFDKNYYLFSPSLYMEICKPLLDTMSVTELKRRLRKDGIIYCNSVDHTVKKNLTNVCGATVRPRFIWVCKEILLSSDNLRLEDVFDVEEGDESNELHR